MRHLVLVLGDQLDLHSTAFQGFDASRDAVWMAEVAEESQHVWSHKARTAMFLAAMRHFRDALRSKGFDVWYRELGGPLSNNSPAPKISRVKSKRDNLIEAEESFSFWLKHAVEKLRPEKLIVVQPGEWRVQEQLQASAKKLKLPLEIHDDRHFFSTPAEFAEHAQRRKQLRMEFFYREMRRKHDVLMDGAEPVGGRWNFDAENRAGFSKHGPGEIPPPRSFPPDTMTREVLQLVGQQFSDHPGKLDHFDWPVTPAQAQTALADFIKHRLPHFGQHQDAMWTAEPYLYHSRLSAAMNLKLLDPRDVVAAAEQAYRGGNAPLAAVEGFIRQILGWREYVRGIYWLYMPQYFERNALKAELPLPKFYWTGETEMNCLRHAIGQTLEYGYAHHIQRLMITGLFALLLGVRPQDVHAWYLAVYVDAVEWVELPNTLGMSQFGDGGVMASKPYCASGKYIDRMSNYCRGCKFSPNVASGENACPFTTLYWDFLARHEKALRGNQRMTMQLKNLQRKSEAELRAIRQQAKELQTELADT